MVYFVSISYKYHGLMWLHFQITGQTAWFFFIAQFRPCVRIICSKSGSTGNDAAKGTHQIIDVMPLLQAPDADMSKSAMFFC